MEKRPLVSLGNTIFRMQSGLRNSIDSRGSKWKPKLKRDDFEAVVVEIGRHFLSDRKKY